MKTLGEPAGSLTLTSPYRILIAHRLLENLLVAGTPTLGVQEGQELPFILNSFYLSYLLKEHFPAL